MTLPPVQAQFAATGARAGSGTPASFGAFVQREWERYGKLVRELGLKPE